MRLVAAASGAMRRSRIELVLVLALIGALALVGAAGGVDDAGVEGGRFHFVDDAEFTRASQEALGANCPVVLLYHALDCSASRDARRAATQLPALFPTARFFAVDVARSNAAALAGHGVFATPALLAFPAEEGRRKRRFDGARTLAAMAEWVANATGLEPLSEPMSSNSGCAASHAATGRTPPGCDASVRDVAAAGDEARIEAEADASLKRAARRERALVGAATAFVVARAAVELYKRQPAALARLLYSARALLARCFAERKYRSAVACAAFGAACAGAGCAWALLGSTNDAHWLLASQLM